MNSQRLQAKLSALLSVLALFLITQSCSKEDDPSAPGAAEISQNVAAPTPCTSVCLVAGQHMLVGTVGAAMAANGDLLVTYSVTKPGVYLLETHLDVFTSIAQLQAARKLSGGGAIPGKLAFKQSFTLGARVQTYTVTVPKAYLDRVNPTGRDCFYIGSHAALSNGETAWGGMCSESTTGTTSLGSALQFPGNNWGVYFEFCKSTCTQRAIDFTYAWEDLNLDGNGNDRDYNDLVVKSSVAQSPSNLRMSFIASARGASFDHRFSVKIPKAHITGIFGSAGDPAPSFTQDGTYYYITVFESTKQALPGVGAYQFANTIASESCVTPAQKAIVLETDGFNFSSMNYIFEPFITVTPFANSGNPPYDLYIHEVSVAKGNGRNDTWVATDGQRYPNGILIPADWKWPLESMPITGPYPGFRSLNDPLGFNTAWPTTPAANYLTLTSSCN